MGSLCLPKCVALTVGAMALGPNGQVCSLGPHLVNTYHVQVTPLVQRNMWYSVGWTH